MAPVSPSPPQAHAFGRAVRARREALQLSQEELGFDADLDRTYISGIERGVRNPSMKSILRVCRALKTSPSTLLRRAEDASGLWGE